MKKYINYISLFILSIAFITTITSCDKEEEEMEPPTISFKTGGGYTSANASLTAGSAVLIGIEAEKSEAEGEDEDVLKHFNISKSVNGGASVSVYDEDLDSSEEEAYAYDLNTTVSTTVGDTEKYTFTITNRDGLTGQVSLTITAQ